MITSPVRAADQGELELAQIEDVESLSLSELLEQPVVAASRYSQKPGDSPTLVSTIDHATLEQLGHRTLGEAIRGMRGMYTGNDRNYSYLGTRGFSAPGDYNTRFALSVDDHRINDAVYGQASSGLELGLPMIAVERIEVIRGGAFSIYGQNALLGAVQVVTASGATRPGIHVTTTGRANLETFDDPAQRPTFGPRGQDVAASYGVVDHGIDVFVAGAYSYDRGLSAIYMPELAVTGESCVDPSGRARACDGVVSGGDDEEAGTAYGSVRTKHWAFHTLVSRRTKRVPTAAFGTVIGESIQTFDDKLYVDGSYTRSTEHTDLVAHTAVDYAGYHATYPYFDAAAPMQEDPAILQNFDAYDALWVTGEVRGRYRRAHLGRYLSNLELAASVDASKAYGRQFNEDRHAVTPMVYLDRTDREAMMALGAQASGRAFDHLVGFMAVRGDYHPATFGLAVNPQGGIVLDGGDLGRIRASISRGLRAPNFYEQFYVSRQFVLGALGPERSETREVSLERYLGSHMRLLLVGYRQEVEDLIKLTMNADGLAQFVNEGTVRSHGFEGELEGRWDAVRLHATYTRQHATTDKGLTPPNAPTSLASLMVLTPIAGGRGDLGIESWYIGDRLAFNRTTVPPLFVTNLVLTIHKLADGIDGSLGISNVFDERGGDPSSEEHRQSSIPHDPRTIWLRFSLALDR